jgi:hypothetical protein
VNGLFVFTGTVKAFSEVLTEIKQEEELFFKMMESIAEVKGVNLLKNLTPSQFFMFIKGLIQAEEDTDEQYELAEVFEVRKRTDQATNTEFVTVKVIFSLTETNEDFRVTDSIEVTDSEIIAQFDLLGIHEEYYANGLLNF